MPKVFTSKTQKTGEIGEHLACRYLEGKGFKILERNYTKKWGEIDIVAKYGGMTHFIEVKSKSVDLDAFPDSKEFYRPEDNMHTWKVARLRRTIATYIAEQNLSGPWKFGLVVVRLDQESLQAKVEFLEDLVL